MNLNAKYNVFISKGYICLGCGQRYVVRDTHKTYKNSCICKNCYVNVQISNPEFVFQGTKETEFLVSAFVYTGVYREIFLKFKFNGEYAAGYIIGMMLEDYFENIDVFYDFDCIVPVPVSKKRLLERGYNQTDILVQYVSKPLNIPVNNALERVKHSESQSALIGETRHSNVMNAFKVNCDLSGMNVVLFDDVVTTGSTINECARMLKAAGAKRVAVVSSAYVERKIINSI